MGHSAGFAAPDGYAGTEHRRHGFVSLDATGRVVHANAAARRISARRDGLTIDSGLRAIRRADDANLQQAITRATRSRRQQIVRVPRSSGRPDYVVSASPPDSASHGPARVVDVSIVDPDAEPRPRADVLARTFDLTPAEARLLARLVVGDTVEEAAHQLGIAITTARFHLASLFRKTGTKRQTELLRRVLLLPREIGWDSDAP